MFIVIPAYQPDEKLIGVVEGLRDTDCSFVVVDDGSGPDYAGIFEKLERDHAGRLTVIHHPENRGKGRAMKTAFEYIAEHADPGDGLVTVDADGQHLPKDVKKVIETWREYPNSLTLGSRHFTGKVPFKSRWGNGFTRIVFAVTTGVRVWDTQTGLRAFSVARIPEMLGIKGERYDFEISQLLYATKNMIPIVEAPIETVYIEGNKSSHFRAFRDSILINRMILFFMLMSLISFAVDYAVLLSSSAIMRSLPQAIDYGNGMICLPIFGMSVDTHLIALVLGRIVGSACNFILNRNLVFRTGDRFAPLRYVVLIVCLLSANYGLIALLTSGETAPALWIAQLIAMVVLYPVNFILQRKFVFSNKGGVKRVG